MPVDAASGIECYVIVDGRRVIEFSDPDQSPRQARPRARAAEEEVADVARQAREGVSPRPRRVAAPRKIRLHGVAATRPAASRRDTCRDPVC